MEVAKVYGVYILENKGEGLVTLRALVLGTLSKEYGRNMLINIDRSIYGTES